MELDYPVHFRLLEVLFMSRLHLFVIFLYLVAGVEFEEKDNVDKGYKWTESDETVEISIYKHFARLKELGLTDISAKNVKVEFKSKSLKVLLQNSSGQSDILLDISLAGNNIFYSFFFLLESCFFPICFDFDFIFVVNIMKYYFIVII